MGKRLKTPQAWLAVAIMLIMVGSFLAHFFNTSFYNVDVTQITFNTDKGKLSGLLYMPEGAGPQSPRPTIITTHGYLNAKEMQAAPAIEMSRRGFVVLALDLYAHGDSFLNKIPEAGSLKFMSFWPTALYDAVKYIYGQNYVLKDKDGNGIIAVSGHSMGGFSATMAMASDEKDYLNNLKEGKPAFRRIKAVLTAGSDYTFTSYLGVTSAAADKLYANRTVGVIAAQFDEFFFDKSASAAGETMVKKDYINTDEGKAFLRNPANPEVGVFYPTAEGGQRVIYQPHQTHPWNHISIKTTRNIIDFYNKAFADFQQGITNKGGQIWILKELSETLGLIGYYLLFIPIILLLSKTPCLRYTVTEPTAEFAGPTTGGSKIVFWVILAIGTIIPFLFFTTFLNKKESNLDTIGTVSLIVFILAIIVAIIALVRKKEEDVLASVMTAVGAFALLGLSAGSKNIFPLGPVYNSPIINNVAFWALGVTAVTFFVLSAAHQYVDRYFGVTLKQYGFITSWKNVLAAFFTAVIAAAFGFVILQIIDVLFKTDFRFWLVVVRAFNKQHLITSFYFMPFFFLYFVVNGVALQTITNSKYMQGTRGYLIALLMNIGGLIAWLIIQYGSLFIAGKGVFAKENLNPIVLIGLTVNLGIATIITKKCLEKTNNVYTGAFLNTFLISVASIAGSTMYWSLAA